MVPSYSKEFGISLLLYLQETVRLVALPDQRLEDIEKTRQLAQLYGDGVLPAELLRLVSKFLAMRSANSFLEIFLSCLNLHSFRGQPFGWWSH